MDKDCTFNSTESKLSSCFPTEFPYEFDSPEDSIFGSLETDNNDCHEFLAGLTRRLSQQLAVKPEKKWVVVGSPESTLNGLGSWSASSSGSPNGVLSPPTTPFGEKNATWDLIHEAAGEIARLKFNSEVNKFQDMSFKGPTRTHDSVRQLHSNSSELYSRTTFGQDSQYQHHMSQEQVPYRECTSVWARQQVKMGMHAQFQPLNHLLDQQLRIPSKVMSLGCENGSCVPHSAWPPPQMQQAGTLHHRHLQHSSSGMRAMRLGGSGVRRESAGTGVFLPRRYGNINHPSEPKKKTTCPTVMLPARVIHALNLNMDDMKTNSHAQPSCNTGFASDYGALMARRNAILAQHQRSLRPQNVVNHEIQLPQEWTY